MQKYVLSALHAMPIYRAKVDLIIRSFCWLILTLHKIQVHNDESGLLWLLWPQLQFLLNSHSTLAADLLTDALGPDNRVASCPMTGFHEEPFRELHPFAALAVIPGVHAVVRYLFWCRRFEQSTNGWVPIKNFKKHIVSRCKSFTSSPAHMMNQRDCLLKITS